MAQKVAKELGVILGKAEIIRFADTESRVWVEEDIQDKIVFVLQPFSPPVDENLVEFLLLIDALKRLRPKKMIAIVPYYGYGRQDKVFRKGEALSAQVVADLIEAAGFEKLITIHLHSLRILKYFKIPVVHLSTASICSQVFSSLKNENKDWVAVAPDEVAQKEVKKFAQPLGITTAYIEKKRDYTKKDKHRSIKVTGQIKGKNCVMFDDLSSTGGTIVHGAKLLKEKGAKKIIAALSHLVVGEAAEKIVAEKTISQLIITDTISYPGQKPTKLKIISVAPLLAEAIKSNINQ